MYSTRLQNVKMRCTIIRSKRVVGCAERNRFLYGTVLQLADAVKTTIVFGLELFEAKREVGWRTNVALAIV